MRADAKWLFETLEAYGHHRHLPPCLCGRRRAGRAVRPQGADRGTLAAQTGFLPWANAVVLAPPFIRSRMRSNEKSASRSLAIILDTSNAARVDDEHWRLAAHSIRIDHHIQVESFCDEELIDPSAAATCELLGALCEAHGEQLSSVCAQRLYGGLISDTINFTISSVSARTLRVASYLFGFGVDVVKLNMQQFGTNLRDFRYESHLREADAAPREDSSGSLLHGRIMPLMACLFRKQKRKCS